MDEFMTVFGHFMQRSQYTAGQLATLSGVPKRSLHNWLEGRVQKPHRWQTVVQVAAALQLSEADANKLLLAAAHKPLHELRRKVVLADELALLTTWPHAANVPFQARWRLPYFVGREHLIEALTAELQKGQSVAICSLRGMGGIGKTALAAYLGYHLQAAFPDGVLWAQVNVSDTMSILNAFAAAYDVDVSHHRDVETRSAAVRHLLSQKRVLIILDNAENSAQVRPLLPPSTGNTAVIITTRQDLQVADEMYRVVLPPFDPQKEEALKLFDHFLGAATVRRYRAELSAIADLLEHLPLAIALSGGRLANQTAIPSYLAELREANRLDALVREDRSVRLSFDLSYAALPPDLQPFFTALGAFGGEDFGLEAAVFVTNSNEKTATAALQKLVQLSLVQPTHNNRYRLHALLREYALEKLSSQTPSQRMADYFVEYAVQATEDAVRIQAELSNLHAALAAAQNLSMKKTYIRGVINFVPYLHRSGELPHGQDYLAQAIQYAEELESRSDLGWLKIRQARAMITLGQIDRAEALTEAALQAGREVDDSTIVVLALTDLGSILGGYRHDYAAARHYLLQAADLAEAVGNRVALSKTIQLLANIAYEQGDWQEAEAKYHDCLEIISQEQGLFNANAADALMNLGVIKMTSGKLDEAKQYLLQAAETAREIKYVVCFCMTVATLADVFIGQGVPGEGGALLNEALVMAREANYPVALVRVLSRLGLVSANLGEMETAVIQLEEALALTQNFNQPWDELDVLIQLGEVHLANRAAAEARRNYQMAFEKVQDVQQPEPMAFVIFGLAKVSGLEGDLAEARRQGQKSLALFEKMGHFAASEVGRWLSELPEPQLSGV